MLSKAVFPGVGAGGVPEVIQEFVGDSASQQGEGHSASVAAGTGPKYANASVGAGKRDLANGAGKLEIVHFLLR